jgi:hypothetical protein
VEGASLWFKAPMNGTIIAIKIRKVKTSEILVADLLPYRSPWINESKNAPVIIGIKAVIEGVSDPMKLQRPSIIRTKEFIMLTK